MSNNKPLLEWSFEWTGNLLLTQVKEFCVQTSSQMCHRIGSVMVCIDGKANVQKGSKTDSWVTAV